MRFSFYGFGFDWLNFKIKTLGSGTLDRDSVRSFWIVIMIDIISLTTKEFRSRLFCVSRYCCAGACGFQCQCWELWAEQARSLLQRRVTPGVARPGQQRWSPVTAREQRLGTLLPASYGVSAGLRDPELILVISEELTMWKSSWISSWYKNWQLFTDAIIVWVAILWKKENFPNKSLLRVCRAGKVCCKISSSVTCVFHLVAWALMKWK